MTSLDEQLEKRSKYMLIAFQSQVSFLHHLTIVSSTLLGILVAFHPAPTTALPHLLLYLSAMALLALSIALSLIVSRSYSTAMQDFYQTFRIELQRSLESGHPMEPIQTTLPNWKLKLIPASYTLLSIALVLLVIYTGLVLFS